MGKNDKVAALAARVLALQKAETGWSLRETHKGWHVMPPQKPGADARGTTIPYREALHTVENATRKLVSWGLEADEAALKERRGKTTTNGSDPRKASNTSRPPVPMATFTPPVAVEEVSPMNGKPAAAAASVKASASEAPPRPPRVGTPQEYPIPWSQIEDQARDMHFDVPLPTGRGPYSRIVRVEMVDGTSRFRCWHDETECQDTYSTAHNAHLHLGHAHPSAVTLQRRQARADAEAATAASKRTAASPKARTTPAPVKAAPATPTPAVMPRKVAPTAVPTAAPAPAPAPAPTRPLPQPPVAPGGDMTAKAAIDAMTGLLQQLEHYRTLALDAKAAYEPQLADLRAQVGKLEQQLAREQTRTQAAITRAQVAEERVAAFEQGLGALAGLAGLMPKAA